MATTRDGRRIDIERDIDARVYRARIDGEVSGEAEFLLTNEYVVFTHTRVPAALEGQGIASTLIRWALDNARSNGYSVVPTCPFVQAFIDRNAEEYNDLVYRSSKNAS